MSNVSALTPMRLARIPICSADSSPEMYKTFRGLPDARANLSAASSNRVDFPTPGSPASKTHWPATKPPPSTRSNSSIPVEVRSTSPSGISFTGRAGFPGATPAVEVRNPALLAATEDSVTELHAWHSGHRPTHLWPVHPHSVHLYDARTALAMTLGYAPTPTAVPFGAVLVNLIPCE